MNRETCLSAVLMSAATASLASARPVVVPGADGSDGALSPTADVTIDLGAAPSGTWDAPSPSPGNGVYDGTQWAVVFKYTDVNIPAGVTVRFNNRACNAPVVWLVSGSVTIDGTLTLDGAGGSSAAYAVPGPGGFAGGRSYVSSVDPGSAGFGPGGGRFDFDSSRWGAASHATAGGGEAGPVYGGNRIIPLMGGSGGTVRVRGDGLRGGATCGCCVGGCGGIMSPGGGGGAILVACANTITFGSTGRINARGGSSTGVCCNDVRGCGGSGGAIRLVAHSVMGPANTTLLLARGGDNASSGYPGGDGRIRIEANSTPIQPNQGDTGIGFGLPGATAKVWPDNLMASIKILSVGGTTVPTDPCGGFTFGLHDVVATSTPGTHVIIETRNVPTNALVKLRVVRTSGPDDVYDAVFQSGSQAVGLWRVELTIPANFSVFQAIAQTP